MGCDIQPRQLDGQTVYRVGRAPRPWGFTPWRYAEKGVFQGRWDDPEGEYRVLYVSASAFGAFVEVLADFRPDPTLIAGLAEIEDEDQKATGVLPGRVPISWLRGRVLVDGLLSGTFADVSHSRSLATLRRNLAPLVVELGLPELDGSAVRASAPRAFTQAISRYLYHCLESDRPQFAGVFYRSKHGDNLENWGVFERGEDQISLVPSTAHLLRVELADLGRAIKHHRLQWLNDEAARV
jgi:hypothetical protein